LSSTDAVKYVQRVSNKTKSPSAVSVMFEVVLSGILTVVEVEGMGFEPWSAGQ
jgi:hypothetical protein